MFRHKCTTCIGALLVLASSGVLSFCCIRVIFLQAARKAANDVHLLYSEDQNRIIPTLRHCSFPRHCGLSAPPFLRIALVGPSHVKVPIAGWFVLSKLCWANALLAWQWNEGKSSIMFRTTLRANVRIGGSVFVGRKSVLSTRTLDNRATTKGYTECILQCTVVLIQWWSS